VLVYFSVYLYELEYLNVLELELTFLFSTLNRLCYGLSYLLYSIIKKKISLQRSPYFFCVRYSNYHRSHHIHFVRSDISDNGRLHSCSEYLLSCRFLPYSTIHLYILDSNQYQLRTFALIAFLLNS
jgi:hypothetical protein